MQDFIFYLKIGWTHIISWDALDHLLFMLALASIYLLRDWKRVLVLITAFTIGHSLTLVLSVYDLVTINARWVEFLIPCTIIATALFNLWRGQQEKRRIRFNYAIALFFGLVHGLGFANTIRFMLADQQQIGIPLLGFNAGLELGQLLVVTAILVTGQVLVQLRLPRNWWVWGTGLLAIGWAGIFAIRRFP